MSSILIQDYTTKEPITMIGKEAGVCWGADTDDPEKNYKRGLNCLRSGHGRTFEYPDVYMVLDGYSARVIREWYTHIGGSPTRLQESTRYVDSSNFDYVVPLSMVANYSALMIYRRIMEQIRTGIKELEDTGAPREDIAMALPLGMTTKIVCKHNLRNLIDMSHQRMCTRAYYEYRALFSGICDKLSEYSPEWKTIVDEFFVPKCEYLGYCPEKNSCGRKEKRPL